MKTCTEKDFQNPVYLSPVAAHQRSGLVTWQIQSVKAPIRSAGAFLWLLYGGCAQGLPRFPVDQPAYSLHPIVWSRQGGISDQPRRYAMIKPVPDPPSPTPTTAHTHPPLFSV